MATINDLIAENTHVALPREVLMLLRWLMEHHATEIKKLTKRALYDGLHSALTASYSEQQQSSPEETYTDIAYFFGMVEAILKKELDDYNLYKTHAKGLQTTINQIDSALCDTNLIQSSIQQSQINTAKYPTSNARETLFKELLRQWRPRKSSCVN